MLRSFFGQSRIFFVILSVILSGCASPEEKAQTYYENGAKFLEQKKYVEAQLEFRNALKLNEDLAPAWLGLAKIDQQNQKWRPALGALKRVTELEPKNAEAHADISRIMLFGGNLDEALKYSNIAFELAPERVETLTLRSVILLKLGDREAALVHARRALEVEPANAEALLVLAAERLEANDIDNAMTFIESGLEDDPSNVGMLVFKIRVLEMKGDKVGAKDVLAQLAGYYPEERAYRKALVGYYIGNDDKDAAEIEIRAIAKQFPDDEEAQLDVIRFINSYRGFDAARQEMVDLIGRSKEPAAFELNLAQLQFQNGEKAAAELRLRELTEKYAGTDEGANAKILLAQMLLELKREDEARALVSEVLAADTDNVRGLSIRAQLAIKDGEFENAINDLRAALNEAGQSAALKVQLGRALEMNGSVELAEENFAIAMRESNFQNDVGLEYARFLQRQGNLDRAEEIIDELMSRSRADTKVLTELAGIKLRKQDWEGAQEVAEKLKEVDKDSGIASEIFGISLSGQKKFDESIEVLSAAYENAPANAGRMLSLVRTYMQSGKPDAAEAFLNGVLKANPDNPQALSLLGTVTMNDPGRQTEAEAQFRKAIETAPDQSVGYRALAGYYVRHKNAEAAEQVVREGLKAIPDDIPLGLLLAGFLEARGEIEEAISVYEGLYELQPQAQVIANNLASLLSDYRDDEASLNRAFELASRLKSSDVAYFKDTLAWVHFRRGDTAVALDLLEDAVVELPDMPIVRYHLAQVYLKEGRKQSAKIQLETLLEMDKTGSLPFRSEAENALLKLNETN